MRKESGMIRKTRQREAILRAFEQHRRPLTAAEVFALAKEIAPRIGMRTVYRNIRELVEEGKLAGVDYPGQPIRYAQVLDKAHKPHLICRRCRKLFELDLEIPDVAVKNPPGFVIEGEEVIFYGRCENPDTCVHNPATRRES